MLGGGAADLLLFAVGADVVIVQADAPGLAVHRAANLDPTRRCVAAHG